VLNCVLLYVALFEPSSTSMQLGGTEDFMDNVLHFSQ